MNMRESSLEALLLMASLYVMHEKHAKARVLLDGLYDLAPEDVRILRLLAYSLIMEGEYERGLAVLRELENLTEPLGQHAENTCFLRLEASALWGMNRTEEARTILERSYPAEKERNPAGGIGRKR
jgi:uncharacterized protein HemY